MADYQYLDATGTIVADTADILAEVQAEYRAAFGEDLIVTPDTPQGALITAEALARAEVVQNNAALANQINPNLAGGVFQDAVAALTGTSRSVATRSVVTATLTGIAGTIIPAGSQAKTAAGNIFESLSTVTLSVGGTASVDFRAVAYGPVPAGVGELNSIVSSSAVLGWETITNPAAATLGTADESDAVLKAKRKNTLAIQGISLPEAITSALYATEGVKSLAFRENTADTQQTIDGITLSPKSIYVCVDGGSDLDIAAALLENKSGGCAWNGTTTVNLVEPSSGQAYNVKFSRPETVNVLIRVTARGGTAANIKAAILAFAKGELDGELGFVVGGNVSPFELASAINRQIAGVYVQKVELSLTDPISYTTDPVAIGIWQKAFTNEGLITVVVA